MFYLRPLAAAVLMSASTTTFSQVTPESEPNSMEEVIVAGQFLYTDTVNALKTPTPILDVPQSLSLMSAADIRERGFNSIGEVIAYMPGVTSSQGEVTGRRLFSVVCDRRPIFISMACETMSNIIVRSITWSRSRFFAVLMHSCLAEAEQVVYSTG